MSHRKELIRDLQDFLNPDIPESHSLFFVCGTYGIGKTKVIEESLEAASTNLHQRGHWLWLEANSENGELPEDQQKNFEDFVTLVQSRFLESDSIYEDDDPRITDLLTCFVDDSIELSHKLEVLLRWLQKVSRKGVDLSDFGLVIKLVYRSKPDDIQEEQLRKYLNYGEYFSRSGIRVIFEVTASPQYNLKSVFTGSSQRAPRFKDQKHRSMVKHRPVMPFSRDELEEFIARNPDLDDTQLLQWITRELGAHPGLLSAVCSQIGALRSQAAFLHSVEGEELLRTAIDSSRDQLLNPMVKNLIDVCRNYHPSVYPKLVKALVCNQQQERAVTLTLYPLALAYETAQTCYIPTIVSEYMQNEGRIWLNGRKENPVVVKVAIQLAYWLFLAESPQHEGVKASGTIHAALGESITSQLRTWFGEEFEGVEELTEDEESESRIALMIHNSPYDGNFLVDVQNVLVNLLTDKDLYDGGILHDYWDHTGGYSPSWEIMSAECIAMLGDTVRCMARKLVDKAVRNNKLRELVKEMRQM